MKNKKRQYKRHRKYHEDTHKTLFISDLFYSLEQVTSSLLISIQMPFTVTIVFLLPMGQWKLGMIGSEKTQTGYDRFFTTLMNGFYIMG